MIYLDYSATAPLAPGVREAVGQAMEDFGNPSSLHAPGLAAAALVKKARDQLYDALGVPAFGRIDAALPLGAGNPKGKRLFFTSCGTESDNLAIFGAIRAKNFRKTPRIITTNSEHPAMLAGLRALSDRGAVDLVLLSTAGGKIDLSELDAALTPETLLISIMLVNNETGALYDVQSAFALAKRKVPSVITHTDAVQGFLKVNLPYNRLGADLITISGHKIGAPKGVGGLLVDNGLLIAKRIAPLLYGGGQEGGLRSGTENVMGIVGFGEAAAYGKRELPGFENRMRELRETFAARIFGGADGTIDRTADGTDGLRINEPAICAPHIISLTLPGIRSETMLRYLSDRGIYVSNGSACSSHGRKGNSVLENFGLTPGKADSTIRISMGDGCREDDLIAAADAILRGCGELERSRG